ncbi:MAG: nucleoside 2-deoxyribosyltransferase [Nitrososphaeria archaeon]
MKVIVCGPIAYGSVEEIRLIQKILEKEGYDVIDQFKVNGMDYSFVKDFRDKRDVAENIVKNDLAFIDECDILVALCDSPSFGTAIEAFYAKMHGKIVVVLSGRPQPSPWPIAFADAIVRSLNELKLVLSKYVK